MTKIARERAFIETEVVLLSKEEGGRNKPLQSLAYGGGYRPHIVIQDRAVRRVKREMRGNQNGVVDEYLGVAFWSGPDLLPEGTSLLVTMILFYYPNPMYDACVPGATFTLREGGKIVGHGEIKKQWIESET